MKNETDCFGLGMDMGWTRDGGSVAGTGDLFRKSMILYMYHDNHRNGIDKA